LSTVRRVARNTGIIIVGDIVFRLISLVVTIYLARYLGTAGFGKYNFVFAYLAFFNILTDLGLQTILVREMSRDPSITPKLIGNAYIIRLILTVTAIISSIVVITLMSYPADTTTYVYIASLTVLFVSFSDFYRTIFEANLRMEYSIIAKLAFKGLSAGLILWIVFTKGTLLHIMIALVFSEMVKTLLSYLFSRKFVRPRFEIDFKLWRYLLREALPLALSSVILIIYYRIDVVMLSMMKGDTPVGLYSAAYKLSEPLSLIPSALVTSLFPIMSASFKSSREKLIKTYRLGIKYILIIMLPIAMGTTLLADKIIFWIYGMEFSGSVTALQILIWALVFTSINPILTRLLTSIGEQKLNTVSHTLCAIVNVTLNLILIPTLNYNGAAVATVITNIVFSMLNFYFIFKHMRILPPYRIFMRLIISILFIAIFIYFASHILNILLTISLAIGTYLVTLMVLKVLNGEDISLFRKILKM